MEEEKKKSRKIEMKLVEDKNKRMVHLCKRRKGLFKKAHSLHELTGAEIAVIVFSVAGHPQTNDSPSFDATLDRFLAQDLIPPPQISRTLTDSRCFERQDLIFTEPPLAQTLIDFPDFERKHLISSEPIDVDADMVKSCVERIDQSLQNSGDLDLDRLVALRREAEELKQKVLDRKRKREEDDQLLRSLLEFA